MCAVEFTYPENFVNEVISLIYPFINLSPLRCSKHAFKLLLEHFLVAVRACSVGESRHPLETTVLRRTNNFFHPVTKYFKINIAGEMNVR